MIKFQILNKRKVVLKMKVWFYKSVPVILSVTGFAIIICLYFVHDYLYSRWHWGFWLILSLVNVCSGILIGTLVKKLHQGANKDPLTGLHNRRCFYDRIGYETEKMKRTKLPLSLAIIDIDNFKTINDTYGHLEGDRVLVELAGIFKAHARANDTVVRFGGEEFAMILPETDKEGALAFALALKKIDVGVAYAVWSAVGTASIAIIGYILFKLLATFRLVK